MSFEALAYVKTLDLGDREKTRLLLYVLAENTLIHGSGIPGSPMFSSGYSCRVGNNTLSFDTRTCRRTIVRQLEILSAKVGPDGARQKPIIIRRRRYPQHGGRLHDEIRLVGFKRWFFANYGSARRAYQARTSLESGKNSGQEGKCQNVTKGRSAGKKGNVTDRESPDRRQHELPTNKNLTLTLESKDAREGAREDSISDLEVKAVLSRLRQNLGDKIFGDWFSYVSVRHEGALAIFEASAPFVRDWLNAEEKRGLIEQVCEAQWPGVEVAIPPVRPRATNDNTAGATKRVVR